MFFCIFFLLLLPGKVVLSIYPSFLTHIVVGTCLHDRCCFCCCVHPPDRDLSDFGRETFSLRTYIRITIRTAWSSPGFRSCFSGTDCCCCTANRDCPRVSIIMYCMQHRKTLMRPEKPKKKKMYRYRTLMNITRGTR